MTSTTEYVSICKTACQVFHFLTSRSIRCRSCCSLALMDLAMGLFPNLELSISLWKELWRILWLIPEYCWFNHLFSLVASDPLVSFRHLIFTIPSTPDCKVIGFLALISVCPGSENKQIYSSTASLEPFVVFSNVQLRKQWTLPFLAMTL